MDQKNLAKVIVFTFALMISMPIASQMAPDTEGFTWTEPYQMPVINNSYYEMNDQYYRDNNYDPYNGYSVSTYNHDYDNNYNYAYTLHARCKRNASKGFNSDSYLHRRYDNSTNFSSGISSYQGTSTGPGPNGGYPGSPRGVYKTHYIPHEY